MRADATLAEQAIGNVIGNAIVHTPAETRVLVDAIVDPQEVALRVTDDGPGIPAQALPQIFDKFVKADTTQADGGHGTGLGLAIAKGIMEAHGGSIMAESPPAGGRGTRIVLTFPRQGMRRMRTKTQVLVVDDEAAILRFLKPALEANDYEMTSAGSIAEATKRIAAEFPGYRIASISVCRTATVRT